MDLTFLPFRFEPQEMCANDVNSDEGFPGSRGCYYECILSLLSWPSAEMNLELDHQELCTKHETYGYLIKPQLILLRRLSKLITLRRGSSHRRRRPLQPHRLPLFYLHLRAALQFAHSFLPCFKKSIW